MVAWWIRLWSSMQETWVRSLVREDPTHLEATKSVLHNCWVSAREPESHRPCVATIEAHRPQSRRNTREATARGSWSAGTREKPTRQWRLSTAKNKWIKYFQNLKYTLGKKQKGENEGNQNKQAKIPNTIKEVIANISDINPITSVNGSLNHSLLSNSILIPWTVACRAPLSMGFSRVKILEWVAIPFSRRSSQPGNRTGSPAWEADSLPSEAPGKPPTLNVNTLNAGIKRERPPLATTREGLHSNEDLAQPIINK